MKHRYTVIGNPDMRLDSNRYTEQLRCFSDPVFWLLMAAGPVVWLCLWGVLKMPITYGASMSSLQLLVGILLYPVLEEVVFRGSLQGFFRASSWLPEWTGTTHIGISSANILTSIVFTAFHFIGHSAGWAMLVIVPSLVFGWARDRYSNLTASIALHAFYNAGIFWLFN